MTFHIHTGPGHHDKILLEELRKRGINYSYTSRYPQYEYGEVKDKSIVKRESSLIYSGLNWLIYGVKNKIPGIKKSKNHLDLIYPLYDAISSKFLGNCNTLFCWPQVSLSSIRKVKKRNGLCILEYPIPHIHVWMRMLEEESMKFNLSTRYTSFSNSLYKRMILEINEVDYISIPSVFVKRSFIDNGIPEEKLMLNNYGIDHQFFFPEQNKGLDRPFTIIFVGTVEIRKGVSYLLEAFSKISTPGCQLKIIGKIHPHFESLRRKYEKSNIKWMGLLSKETTRHEMRNADLMVMPSILEGLSLTIPETMSSGTPVISSENAGGLDIIDEGVDGFIIPNRSVDAIYERLKWSIENREKLIEMGKRAREKVLSGFTMDLYGERMEENLKKLNVI